MQIVKTHVESKRRKRRAQSPTDSDFFGPAEASLPSKQHPEQWQRYWDTFLNDADFRRFSIRRNGDDGWFPARGKQFADGQLVKQWDRPLSSSRKELDVHLSGLRDDGSLSWMGAFGGKYTSKYNVDVDNHEAKGKGYHDSRGRWVQVADLSVDYLKLARVTYDAITRLDRPTIIVTSSRSLGLNIWQHIGQAYPAADVFRKMTGYLEDRDVNRHLNHLFPDPDGKWKQMEVFPMYGRDGKANRLQRLPFGHGSVTLASSGIIRPWQDQLGHFLAPGPLPTFDRVVDHLLTLYVEQYRAWHLSGNHLPPVEHETHRQRLGAARRWLKAGCTIENPPERKLSVLAVPETESVSSGPIAKPSSPAELQRVPDWLSLPREQRVFLLATHGLPDKGSLNRSLYLLAVHLLGIELFNRADAEELAKSVLERWCLTKHNGLSKRLEGSSSGPKVAKIVEWAIYKARRAVMEEDFVRLRGKRYRRPLRVRWLVCEEGPVSLYSPSQASPISSVIYCVSHSVIHDPASLKVNRLPPGHLEYIRRLAGRKPQKAIEFNVMFANYLDAMGGKATVNRDNYMVTFLGYTNPSQWSKFKSIGEEAGIFRMSEGHKKGASSREYVLLINLET